MNSKGYLRNYWRYLRQISDGTAESISEKINGKNIFVRIPGALLKDILKSFLKKKKLGGIAGRISDGITGEMSEKSLQKLQRNSVLEWFLKESMQDYLIEYLKGISKHWK